MLAASDLFFTSFSFLTKLLVCAYSPYPLLGRIAVLLVCIHFVLMNDFRVVQLFKQYLKSCTSITGSPATTFTASTETVELFIIGIAYQTLVFTRRHEWLEHVVERFWPGEQTIAVVKESKSCRPNIKRYAGHVALLTWAMLFMRVQVHVFAWMGRALTAMFTEVRELWLR
jgi:hypothetical protein